MTDEEAKTKWCPYQPYVGSYPTRSPSGGTEIQLLGANCVGSKCMAWRQVSHTEDPLGNPHIVFHGFCGLAGKP